MKKTIVVYSLVSVLIASPFTASAWQDETHLAIARAAGYTKWYNSAGADMVKVKVGDMEGHNHFSNNPPGTAVTAELVLGQVKDYNRVDRDGHLYGAIIASVRNYIAEKRRGKYREYHLAYGAHYIGDLSQPLHNVPYSRFNKKHHRTTDGVINEGALDNLDRITLYPIAIASEKDLVLEIARIANISMALGQKMEAENRPMTPVEAYRQVSHSASLLKAVVAYLEGVK